MATNTPTKEKEAPRQEVTMSREQLTMLKQLYVLRSYSGFEEVIRHAIIKELNRLGIPYLNYNGNIIGVNHPGKPLLSAHMDMVNTEGHKLKGEEYYIENPVFTIDNSTNIRLYRDKDRKHQTSLGADDKNGIWVILNLLALGHEINFAFCHGEETGAIGSGQIIVDEDLGTLIESCSYGIIIDRRNPHDIIGYENKYCMGLDDAIQTFAASKGFKFACARGSCSDADNFAKLLECVNISCGYYDAHTSTEYTNLNELENTFEFLILMLEEMQYKSVSAKRMQAFKSCKNPYAKAIVEVVKDNTATPFEKKNKRWTQRSTSESTQRTPSGQGSGSSWGSSFYASSNGHPDILPDDDDPVDYEYTIELRAEEEMAQNDYYDVVTNLKCPNCTSSLYILGDDVMAMEADGYSLAYPTPEIGGECSCCGLIMNLTEVIK